MPDSVWIIDLLVLIILGLVGWHAKSLHTRIEKLTDKLDRHKELVSRDFKSAYKHQEAKQVEIREELHRMSDSIRKEIQSQSKSQTALLVSIIKKSHGEDELD